MKLDIDEFRVDYSSPTTKDTGKEKELIRDLGILEFFKKHFCANDFHVIEQVYCKLGDGFALLKYDEREEYGTQDYSNEYKHYKIDCFCAVIYSVKIEEFGLSCEMTGADNYNNRFYHIPKLIFFDYYHNWRSSRKPIALINSLNVDIGGRIDYFLSYLLDIKTSKAINYRNALDSFEKRNQDFNDIIEIMIIDNLNPDKEKKDDKGYYKDVLGAMTKISKR